MKVHLAGTWGRGSFGDDCAVEAFKAKLRSNWTDEDFVQEHGGRGSFSPTCQDGGILAGTGLLYSDPGPRAGQPLKAHLRYPAAMQLFGKPTFLLALGVQERLPPSGMSEFLPVLENARVLTVRDDRSGARLADAGVRRPILRSADLAYLRHRRPRIPSVAKKKPVMGVAVSEPSRIAHPIPGLETRVIEALEQLDDEFQLRFYSFDARDARLAGSWTRPASHTVYDPDTFNVERFEEAILTTDLVLTSGLHGAILAAASGIPFVGMGAPGEEMDRECAALDHAGFITLDSSAETIAESVRSAWAQRYETYEPLRCAARRQSLMAQRSVDLLAAEFTAGERGPTLLPEGGSRLAVWAAPDAFFPEVASVLDSWGGFDLLASIHSGADHPNVVERLVAPAPGLIHWTTFPTSLRERLEGAYDTVLVFHPGSTLRSSIREVAERSRDPRSGAPWEFRTWTQRLGELEPTGIPRGVFQ